RPVRGRDGSAYAGARALARKVVEDHLLELLVALDGPQERGGLAVRLQALGLLLADEAAGLGVARAGAVRRRVVVPLGHRPVHGRDGLVVVACGLVVVRRQVLEAEGPLLGAERGLVAALVVRRGEDVVGAEA